MRNGRVKVTSTAGEEDYFDFLIWAGSPYELTRVTPYDNNQKVFDWPNEKLFTSSRSHHAATSLVNMMAPRVSPSHNYLENNIFSDFWNDEVMLDLDLQGYQNVSNQGRRIFSAVEREDTHPPLGLPHLK